MKSEKVPELVHHCGTGLVCVIERLVVDQAQLLYCWRLETVCGMGNQEACSAYTIQDR